MIQKKLLVTGCGRSGTLYATEVWRTVGLDIRHERPVPPNGVMGEDGIASWYMAVDDPNPPYGPGGNKYSFDYIIHQVRQPLKVIASVAQFILRVDVNSKQYIERNCPEIRDRVRQSRHSGVDSLVYQAALYWYYWNQLAESKADITLRVEELITSLPELCQEMDIEFRPDGLDEIPNTINERRNYLQEPPWILTWEYIKHLDEELYNNITEQAKRYGYL